MRVLRELAISAVIAAAVTLALAGVTFDPDKVTNWQAWFVGLGASMVRAAAAAAIAELRRLLPGSVPAQ